jgi:hypothetical protein
MQNIASAMSSGNPGQVARYASLLHLPVLLLTPGSSPLRSVEEQEDAMMQEAIRLSMMDAASGSGTSSSANQDDSSPDPPAPQDPGVD